MPRRLLSIDSGRSARRTNRERRQSDFVSLAEATKELQEKWAQKYHAKWGVSIVSCTVCDYDGATKRDEQGRILEYCTCSKGQQRKKMDLEDFQNILIVRRSILMEKLHLPKGRADQTIESCQEYLRSRGVPPMPEHLRKFLTFLEGWSRDGHNLFMYGTSGNCKTGLMIPGAKLLIDRALQERWDIDNEQGHWYARYVRSVDFIKELQAGFKAENPKERTAAIIDEYASVPLLIFDDFGKGIYRAGGEISEYVAKEYFALFDARAGHHPTFITSNMTPAQILREFDEYLYGRVFEGTRIIKAEGANVRILSAFEMNPDIDPAELGIEMPDEGDDDLPQDRKHLKVVG